MRSFAQDGSMQDSGGQDAATREKWQGTSAYASDQGSGDRPEGGDRDAMELRLAVLARAIEHEIIPRLMLAHRAPHECLSLPSLGNQQVTQQDVEAFARLVLMPDEDVALACIETMRQRGISVETIYLDLLAPVARYLGELWEQDLCDFTEVTVGLGRLQHLLRELSPAFAQAGECPTSGRRVLLLPSPGEQHTFGLVMVAEFFRRAGWDVAGGPWEAADPVAMVRREWFDVVGFSVAVESNLEDLHECIATLRKTSLNPQVGIIVGGPVFTAHPEYAAQIQADAVASDGYQAPEMAERLVASRATVR